MCKKVYFDRVENNDCIGVILAENFELISAGTTIYSISTKEKNSEYQRYSNEYNLSFIFKDNIPTIDFYAVPQVDVFATDSFGGLFGTIGNCTDLECEAPICYINQNKDCFIIACNLKTFLQSVTDKVDWRKDMEPTESIMLYSSKTEAEKDGLEFLKLTVNRDNLKSKHSN